MIKVKDLLLSCGNLEVRRVRIHNNKYDIFYSDFKMAIESCGDKSVVVFSIYGEYIDILTSKFD